MRTRSANFVNININRTQLLFFFLTSHQACHQSAGTPVAKSSASKVSVQHLGSWISYAHNNTVYTQDPSSDKRAAQESQRYIRIISIFFHNHEHFRNPPIILIVNLATASSRISNCIFRPIALSVQKRQSSLLISQQAHNLLPFLTSALRVIALTRYFVSSLHHC